MQLSPEIREKIYRPDQDAVYDVDLAVVKPQESFGENAENSVNVEV